MRLKPRGTKVHRRQDRQWINDDVRASEQVLAANASTARKDRNAQSRGEQENVKVIARGRPSAAR